MPIPSVDPTAKSLPRRLGVAVVRTKFGKWMLREVSPRLDPPLLRLSRAERDRLWSLAKQFIASYGDYELTAGDREIPIVALSPAG